MLGIVERMSSGRTAYIFGAARCMSWIYVTPSPQAELASWYSEVQWTRAPPKSKISLVLVQFKKHRYNIISEAVGAPGILLDREALLPSAPPCPADMTLAYSIGMSSALSQRDF